MATSGTYSFAPDLGSLFLNAFSRCQVKRTELTQQHMQDAKNEANLLQIEWDNQGVMQWVQDTQTITLSQGVATYSVPANTVMILDLYIIPGVTGENRLIMPFSRTDLAALANPAEQGFPTSFFFLRTVNPTITFWPVPNGDAIYTATYWRYRQIQDANPSQGGQPELQYLFQDAYVAGLAHRLSRHYAPALEVIRKADAKESFELAMKQNVENVPLFLSPGLEGFYRN